MRTDKVLKVLAVFVVCSVFAVFLVYRCKSGVRILHSAPAKDCSTGVQRDVVVDTYLFVFILTAPTAPDRRKAIRETWLAHNLVSGKIVSRRFVVGTDGVESEVAYDLMTEHEKYNDMLFFDQLVDSYDRLSAKLLKTLVWIHEKVNCRFVFKADDDTFVRLDKLVQEMELRENVARLYWGFFRGDAKVKKKGPWKEQAWILCDTYLPYTLGGGYVLSSDLLPYISMSAPYLQLYNSEDVSLGVWLSPLALNRIHDVRFDTEYKSKGCSNKFIVFHKQSIDMIYSKQEQLENSSQVCPREEKTLPSYDYDWKVPPSNCCKRTLGIP